MPSGSDWTPSSISCGKEAQRSSSAVSRASAKSAFLHHARERAGELGARVLATVERRASISTADDGADV
jgi:hypothetical protein